MRVSSSEESDFYSPLAHRLAVFVDGIQIFNCLEADDKKGEVLILTGEKDPSKPEVEILRGDVEIRASLGFEHCPSFLNLLGAIEESLGDVIREKPLKSAKDLGLDARAGEFWVWDGLIVHRMDLSSAMYYAGFEYVDKEHVTTFGDYTHFSSESPRIASILEDIEDE